MRLVATAALILIGSMSAVADPAPGWWSTKPEHHAGKISSHTRFTIEVPAAVKQNLDPRYTDEFTADDDSGWAFLRVSTMYSKFQVPETLEEFKQHLAYDEQILIEETWKTGFGAVTRDKNSGLVAATIFNAIANKASEGDQSLCRWLVKATDMKGKTLPSWDTMKKACASIAITYQ